MPEILDQFGRPFAKSRMPDRRPLAAAPLTDSFREYVAAGLTPQRLATVFKEADSGDVRRQAELFEQMEERDGHLIGERGKRANVILDVDFEVRPASEDSRDVKVAEFVKETLDNLTDYADVLVSLQDAVGKGYAGLEVDWDVSSGQAVPTGFDFVEQKRLTFFGTDGIVRRTPYLVTDNDPMGIEIPAWKMIFHSYGGKSGHPTRSGIFRVCAWMYLFKNYSLKDWVIFCEVFGMPIRLGKYSPGASQPDKDALATAIRSIGTDAAGIISENTKIEFIESQKGKASGDLYKALADFCNKEMSKAILGGTLTSEVDGKGSYAAANTHNEVRVDLLKADSRAGAHTVRHQLIRPLVGFNFGWDVACPGYEPVWEEPEDLEAKSKWVDTVVNRVAVPVSWYREQFNIPEPEEGEETVGGPAAQTAPEAAKPQKTKLLSTLMTTKDTPEPDPAAAFAERLHAETEVLLDGLVEPVRQLVAKAQSLTEIRDGLIDLYPHMGAVELGETMARAFLAAELAGRFEANQHKP